MKEYRKSTLQLQLTTCPHQASSKSAASMKLMVSMVSLIYRVLY